MPNNATAYGFQSLKDLLSRRVAEVGIPVVNDAIRLSFEEYNRQSQAIMGSLAKRTTIPKLRYMLPGTGTLEPLDEWGNPKPVKPGGSYDVAFPIQGGGTAWGTSRVSRAMMTVEEENSNVIEAMRKDADWIRRHALAALFTNTTWTYNDPDDDVGALTIQPLANADSVTYLKTGGAVATDDHYYAQAASIADGANPFPTLRDELAEHPGNGGAFVAFIPTNLRTSVTGLTEFVDQSNPAVSPAADDTLTSNGAQFRMFGDEVLGHLKSSRIWVVEWKALPDNYGFVLAADADQPLAMREYTAPELQGFFPEFHSPDGNVQVRRTLRYAGFGANNRVGAVAFRIGNASYAIPTGYTAPLAV